MITVVKLLSFLCSVDFVAGGFNGSMLSTRTQVGTRRAISVPGPSLNPKPHS